MCVNPSSICKDSHDIQIQAPFSRMNLLSIALLELLGESNPSEVVIAYTEKQIKQLYQRIKKESVYET